MGGAIKKTPLPSKSGLYARVGVVEAPPECLILFKTNTAQTQNNVVLGRVLIKLKLVSLTVSHSCLEDIAEVRLSIKCLGFAFAF